MKNSKTNSKENLSEMRPNEKSPVVYVRIKFDDCYKSYGDFCFAVHLDYLKSTIKTSHKMLQINSNYKHEVFEKVMNVRFRPTVDIEKFGRSTIQYLSCLSVDDENVFDNVDPGDVIIFTTNIENGELLDYGHADAHKDKSFVDFDEPPLLSGENDIQISFNSKLGLLNEKELNFYLDLLNYIVDNTDRKCTLDDHQMLEMFYPDKINTDEEYEWWQEIDSGIHRLSCYNLIKVQYLKDEHNHISDRQITIPDLSLVAKYFDIDLDKTNEEKSEASDQKIPVQMLASEFLMMLNQYRAN